MNAGNWNYRLRQDPGARNALGRIKFMFPNPYDIYLTTRPRGRYSDARFVPSRTVAFGSRKPIELATLLLRGNEGWGRTRIERLVAKGKNRPILLKDPVPVHIVYLTAWVGSDGSTQFRGDHYNLDAPLVAAVVRQPRIAISQASSSSL